MAAIFYLFNCIFLSILWKQKLNILAGLFLGLAIYAYFYNKLSIKREIKRLKEDSLRLEIIKNNLIARVMSENEQYTIKEMLSGMSNDFREFKNEVRDDIKELTRLFSDYKLSNNERISALEGGQKMTKKTIAIYVGIIAMFIMLAVNTYMSVRG